MRQGYIQDIREKVGHMPIILNATGGVLLNEKNEVLLNLRTDTHNWSLPGGYLEYGETFAEGIIREFKEDSGLTVRAVKRLELFDEGETTYPNGDVTQIIAVLYLVEQVAGDFDDADKSETVALKYWPLDALPPLLNDQNEQMLAWVKARLDAGTL